MRFRQPHDYANYGKLKARFKKIREHIIDYRLQKAKELMNFHLNGIPDAVRRYVNGKHRFSGIP